MRTMIPILKTPLGELYEADCLEYLHALDPDTVDLVFADPPFNLGKEYTSNIDDARSGQEYVEWCEAWLDELVRVLKPGGSLFLWNLPKWNLLLGAYLAERLTFRTGLLWISSTSRRFVDASIRRTTRCCTSSREQDRLCFTQTACPFLAARIAVASCETTVVTRTR